MSTETIQIQTSHGAIVAMVNRHDAEYPGIDIMVGDRVIALVEFTEPGGNFRVHVWANPEQDDPTNCIDISEVAVNA